MVAARQTLFRMSAAAAEKEGAEVLRGSLADLEVLRAGAAQSDGVIYLAFSNDFSSLDSVARSIAEETAAIAALGEEIDGSDLPFVTVSGTPYVAGRVSTEADAPSTEGLVGGRGRAVLAALDLASRGVRTSAVRLPRPVHNEGKGGFAGILTAGERRRPTTTAAAKTAVAAARMPKLGGTLGTVELSAKPAHISRIANPADKARAR